MSAAHAHATLGPAESRRLGDVGTTVSRMSFAAGVVALLISGLLGLLSGNWHQAAKSYLFAFIVILTISLGGLFFTVLHHIVRAGWSVVVRRIAEGFASNLRWIWILFIPIVVATFTTDLYHWMHVVHDGHVDELLLHKSPFFFGVTAAVEDEATHHWEQIAHVPWFWLIRAAAFFAIWAFIANFFVRNSIAQDATGDIAITRKLEKWAPLSMLFYAATQTFAAFDWVMSLEPHWFSTMFPVYFFATSCTGFFGILAVTTYLMNRGGKATHEISAEHYQDIGKLLFAFGIVFWAYIAYSQYMLIWYANLPETTGWFLARTVHGWAPVALLLLVGHFMAPFIILITKHTKRMRPILGAVGAWMVLMHVIDIYWLVMPTVPAEALMNATTHDEFIASVTNLDVGFRAHILDLALLIGMLGLLAAMTVRQLGKSSLIPEGDPRLNESLAFENA